MSRQTGPARCAGAGRLLGSSQLHAVSGRSQLKNSISASVNHRAALLTTSARAAPGSSASPSSVLACAEGPPALVRRWLERRPRGSGGGAGAQRSGRAAPGQQAGSGGGCGSADDGGVPERVPSLEDGARAQGLAQLHGLVQQYFLQVGPCARAPARLPPLTPCLHAAGYACACAHAAAAQQGAGLLGEGCSL